MKNVQEKIKKMKTILRENARDIQVSYIDAGKGIFEAEFTPINSLVLTDLIGFSDKMQFDPSMIRILPEADYRMRILYDLNLN